VKTILNSKDLETIKYFQDYTFSDNESQIILATDVESVFRRSRLGVYYVFNTRDKSVVKISDEKIQEPTLSPNGSKVAYAYKNNLYV